MNQPKIDRNKAYHFKYADDKFTIGYRATVRFPVHKDMIVAAVYKRIQLASSEDEREGRLAFYRTATRCLKEVTDLLYADGFDNSQVLTADGFDGEASAAAWERRVRERVDELFPDID